MYRNAGVVAITLFFPTLVSAAAIGFSGEPVWISNTPIVEGETVLIHAALTNGSNKTLTGNLVFRDGGIGIGSLPLSLKAEEARVMSVSWSPKAGAHEIAVELANPSDSTAKRTEVLKVTVASKDAAKSEAAVVAGLPNLSTDASFTDSQSIQGLIAGVSTQIAEVTAPVFNTVDTWRKSGSNFLSAHSSDAKIKVAEITAKKAALAEKDTPEAKSESRTLTLWQILRTLLLYIYQAFNLLISKAGIFYPVFALAFFFFLWKMWQRMRRPSYDY